LLFSSLFQIVQSDFQWRKHQVPVVHNLLHGKLLQMEQLFASPEGPLVKIDSCQAKVYCCLLCGLHGQVVCRVWNYLL
jgi:hypothetical protein